MANPVDVQTLLFQVAGNLTGGIVDDVASALVAMLALTFIIIGFDYVKDGIESAMQNRARQGALADARRNRLEYENEYIEPVLRDLARARYRENIRKASQ